MKKILFGFAFLMAITFISCGTKEATNEEVVANDSIEVVDSVAVDSIEIVDTIVVDTL